MREILFKGKRKDNGEWVEGSLITSINRAWISSEKTDSQRLRSISNTNAIWRSIEIIPDTICQFTGLCDKNGKRIWESDVVWLVYDGKEHIYQIVWDDSELDFKATNGEENYGTNYEYLLCCDEIKVIGNIFDQPELLQEGYK